MRPTICKPKGVYLADCSECEILEAKIEEVDERLSGEIDAEEKARAEKDTALEGEITALDEKKQDKLEAGDHIIIEGNRISADLSEVEAGIQSLTEADTAINGRIDSLTGTVEANKADADGKISALQDKDASLDSNIEELKQKDEEIDGSIEDLKGDVSSNTSRLNILEQTTARHTTDINSLQQKDTELEAKDTDLQGQITALETKEASDVQQLQNMIDGNITAWFGEVPPTAENAPASDWTTEKDKNIHLKDLYYDTTTGYCYRWTLEGSEYKWLLIEDSDTTKLLSEVETLKQTDAKHDADISGLKEADTSIKESITALEGKDTAHDTAISDLQKRATALEAADKTLTEKDTAQQTEIDALEAADTQFQTDLTALQDKVNSLNVPEGAYVKKAGDTMSGALTTPGLTVSGVDYTITTEQYEALMSLLGG